MNYSEQQTYLMQGRIHAAFLILALAGLAVFCLVRGHAATRTNVAFGLAIAAVVVSLAYTPDYLHLTVNRKKRVRWQIKIRWRLVAAVLLVGLLCSSNLRSATIVLAAGAWEAVVNQQAQKILTSKNCSVYFWLTDFGLLAVLLFFGMCNPLLGAALLAAAAHLAIVTWEGRPFLWSAVVVLASWSVLLVLDLRLPLDREFLLAADGLIFASAVSAVWLVHRAQQHNSRNIQTAQRELMDFTGYGPEKIWRLWWESDQALARNWVQAALDENDDQAMAEWYRQNSELYMFAISGYNLDYKRIRSNLKVLRFGRGACLDYGAGNGEVILELARRGHAATYYDVDGVSAKFATQRSQKRGLEVKFLHTREALAASASQGRFDTVFSLDVLEHLPDLPGQLTFLASLLNPGGLLVFDVPAGTTKSHPMHLNHRVEVRALLTARGLREKRTLLQKLPFVKQEKYVFVTA